MMALMSASVGYMLRDVAVAMPVKLMSPISQGRAPPKIVPGPVTPLPKYSPSEQTALGAGTCGRDPRHPRSPRSAIQEQGVVAVLASSLL